MAAESNYITQSVPVDDIFIVGDRREVNDEAVNALADSIGAIGLQTPVTIRLVADVPDPETGEILDQAFAIVAGRHRLEACRRLGWKYIPVILRDCNEIDAELIEIVENLHRVDLTKEERNRQIRRYAELLEARRERIVPQTAEQLPVDPPKRGRPKAVTTEIAEAIGLSDDTVRRALNPRPKLSTQTPREPALDRHGDPDMHFVAVKLAQKHTVGELQDLIDHITDIIKSRLGNAA